MPQNEVPRKGFCLQNAGLMYEIEMLATFGWLSKHAQQTIIYQIRRNTLETRIFPELSDDQGDQGSPPPRQLQAGITLANRYAIQEVIGIGGMGSVYRARDMHFPNVTKLVAVKEMINTAPDPLVRETIVQNFEREANMLATLHHPSIPRIYDYFTVESRSYLVLEFIHGKDLEAIINETNGFLPENQVLSWAIELCDVLDYLHKHKPDPIIFRDMKPSNVMINHNGDVMLVDFGIAKTFQSGIKGTMIGTEGYSPPEQYRGEATPSADIYALGATIHHALTRRDPRLEPPFSFSERPLRRINSECFSRNGSCCQHGFGIQPRKPLPYCGRYETGAHGRCTQNRRADRMPRSADRPGERRRDQAIVVLQMRR